VRCLQNEHQPEVRIKTMYCRETVKFRWRDNGFTLIELIVSLALLGILTAVLGMGVVGALNVYSVSEENVQIAQQSQLAMARIDRELRELTEVITYSDPTYIIYRNLRDNSAIHAIQFDSANNHNRLLLYSGLSSGETNLNSPSVSPDILLQGVSAFSLSYFQGTQTWNGINDRFLSHIRIDLTMNRSGSIATNSEPFTSLVYLRNTNNYGGATPVAEPPQPPSMVSNGGTLYSCFITACFDGSSFLAYSGNPIFLILPTAVLAGLFFLNTLSTSEGQQRRYPTECKGNTGSALIAVIVAIVLFSTIAAALLPLVGSSGHQSVARDQADKAYLMAESGFRFAAGQYVHAGTSSDAKIAVLNGLHKSLHTTSQGNFSLRVQSYFYRISTAITAGDTDLPTTVPGSLPGPIALMNPSDFNGLKLRVEEDGSVHTIASAAITSENAIIFSMTSHQPALSTGGLVYPVVYPDNTQNLTNHADLVYQQGTGALFPTNNGYLTVSIGNTQYYLNYRINDTVNHRLVDIVNLDDPDMDLTVTNTDEIVLNRHIRLVSIGSYGSGGFEVSRTVTYDTPLYFGGLAETTKKLEYPNMAGFVQTDDTVGTFATEVVNDNTRLQVTSTESAPSSPMASLIAFASSEANETLRKSYQNSGNFLSYDAQVKVGFLNDPSTMTSSDNDYYFAGGISFRLDENNNSYGISIMRGNRRTTPPYDYIENDLVPPGAVDKMTLVLWRQVDSGADSNWLAYKDIDGWPVQDTTLVVRIKEAVVLSFENGTEVPIQKGNVVIGQESGARGRVIQGPILDSGTTWGATEASGYLLLNAVSGDFQDNEDILVVGRGVLATVRSYSSQRTNIIRIYYGTPKAPPCGESGDESFDDDSAILCYQVGTSPLLWPPDLKNDGELSWPANEDYFRLIKWDVVNTYIDGQPYPSLLESAVETGAVILHHHNALQTPETEGNYLSTRPELGLHAYGSGATNIYFDDFGLQLTIRVSAVIPTPVQQ
jgi:prepilin-type N-terminal cleavage/methylation domain-containing protein